MERISEYDIDFNQFFELITYFSHKEGFLPKKLDKQLQKLYRMLWDESERRSELKVRNDIDKIKYYLADIENGKIICELDSKIVEELKLCNTLHNIYGIGNFNKNVKKAQNNLIEEINKNYVKNVIEKSGDCTTKILEEVKYVDEMEL